MPIPKFYILAKNNIRNNNEVYLNLAYRYIKKTPVTWSLQIKIDAKKWDVNKKRIKNKNEFDLIYESKMNAEIEALKKYVLNRWVKKEDITPKLIKQIYPFGQPVGGVTFEFEYKKFQAEKAKTEGPETARQYLNTLRQVLELRPKMMLHELNQHFGKELFYHISAKGNSNSYIKQSALKNLNTFILHLSRVSDFSKFRIGLPDGCTIAKPSVHSLDKLQRKAFFTCNLKNQSLINTRNYCKFFALTGLLFADIKLTQKEHFKSGYAIVKRSKTQRIQGEYIIPVTEELKQVIAELDKGQTEIVPYIKNPTKIRKHVKEIATIAGLNENVTNFKHIGKRKIADTKPFHEVINIKTFRKAYKQILLDCGVNDSFSKLMMGHSLNDINDHYQTLSREKAIEFSKQITLY